MKPGLAILCAALTIGVIAPGRASPPAQATPILGDWTTEGGDSVVRIASCDDALCGTIVSIAPAVGGATARDEENPNPTLRSRPLVGLQILWNLRARQTDWRGGRIYNPDDGATYEASLRLGPDGMLRVSGCIAIVCRTQTWTRSSPHRQA